MLVNTDKELANLICFGEEGKDYSLKNGKVVGEKHVSDYCPAKLANTKFSILLMVSIRSGNVQPFIPREILKNGLIY